APLPAVACELFSPVHGSSVGEVVLAASVDGDTELLAVVQEDAVKDGRLHLGSPDGPDLHMLDLPYVVDADREIQR
nr:folate-binding protein [Pseudomonas sp.]